MKTRVDRNIFNDNWITKLTDRSIISIRGRDAQELLQNTSTQDMKLFEESDDRAAIYTNFLTVKGKTMFDAFVVKPKLAGQTTDDMEYWVDLHQNDAVTLKKHLKRYAMRKNIQIQDISHIINSFSIQTILGAEADKGDKAGYFYKEMMD